MPAQGFGVDKHLTVLPVAALQRLIHSQANAITSDSADTMATRILYQSQKLHTLLRSDVACSLLHAAGITHAEHQQHAVDSQSLLMASNEPGSVLRTCASNGQAHALSYSAYGEAANGQVIPTLMFNGEWLDPSTRCYHLGNGYRLYNPALMRFNSPDDMSPFGAGGVNPYAYCLADPVNGSDPTGHGKITYRRYRQRQPADPRPIAIVEPCRRPAAPVAAPPTPVNAGPPAGAGQDNPRQPTQPPNQAPNPAYTFDPIVSNQSRLVVRNYLDVIELLNTMPPGNERHVQIERLRNESLESLRVMSAHNLNEIDRLLSGIINEIRNAHRQENNQANQ